jgi:hypothetical protein
VIFGVKKLSLFSNVWLKNGGLSALKVLNFWLYIAGVKK